jgi:hypothetical protein
MSLSPKITDALLRLPEADRVDLARSLVESLGSPEVGGPTVEQAVSRLEELVSGRVAPLTEEEFRAEISK